MTVNMLLDTDIIIDFLRGYTAAIAFIKNHADDISISAVSIAELYAGVKGEKEEQELKDFLELFPILPVTVEIAEKAGYFKKKYSKSHRTGLGDSLIGATAIYHNLSLKTLNCKHFPMFPNLAPPYKKSK